MASAEAVVDTPSRPGNQGEDMAVLAGGRAEEVVLNVCFHGIGVPGRPLEPGEGKFWVGAAQFEDLLGVIGRYPWVRVGTASTTE